MASEDVLVDSVVLPIFSWFASSDIMDCWLTAPVPVLLDRFTDSKSWPLARRDGGWIPHMGCFTPFECPASTATPVRARASPSGLLEVITGMVLRTEPLSHPLNTGRVPDFRTAPGALPAEETHCVT